MHRSPFVIPILLGIGVYFLSALWIIFLAFRKNLLFGLACFFFPIAQLLYVALNWKEGRWPFFLQVASYLLIVGTILLVMHSMPHPEPARGVF